MVLAVQTRLVHGCHEPPYLCICAASTVLHASLWAIERIPVCRPPAPSMLLGRDLYNYIPFSTTAILELHEYKYNHADVG